MHRKLIISLLFFFPLCGFSATDVASVCAPNENLLSNLQAQSFTLSSLKKASKLSEILGWLPADNLCGGYFSEPDIVSDYPNPKPIDEEVSTITATGISTFRQTGPTELQGDVTFTQPGRQALADKVVVYRNSETGRLSCLDLYGDVQMREHGKLLVGQYTHIDVEKDTWRLANGIYHIDRPSSSSAQAGWGIVSDAVKKESGVLELSNATYTTCAPTNTPWHLKAKHITLNQETGRGVATNSWLYAGNVPIFYVPYANFPIDKRRQSGFLYPSFGYNSDSGVMIDIPYYFNLAPNYDATFTLTPMTRRGLQMTSLTRYLTKTSEGFVQASVLPSDSEFQRFKQSAPNDYPSSFYNDPFLERLAEDASTRSTIAFHNNTVWNQSWSGILDFNWVSDDYYNQDFGVGPNAVNEDQLLNQAAVMYQNEHWRFLGRLLGFQTLHIINDSFVADQYKRLPQLSLDGHYPSLLYGVDFEVNSEWVNFQHADDFFTGEPYPTGARFHLSPQISRSYRAAAGYIAPAFAIDLAAYTVSNNAIVNTLVNPPTIMPASNPNLNTTRALPIFSVDSGLYFERTFKFLQNSYKQTLEPRAFYLYVPPKYQYDLPIFDTTLPTFDYNQLFRTNRFVGFDRIGDANQVALGLTTKFLDDYTGEQKIDFSLGGIYYIRAHTQCLYPDCSDDPTVGQTVSPVASEFNIYPNQSWKIRGTAAWDPNESQWDNAGVTLYYRPMPQQVFKLGYNFVRDGDPISGMSSDSDRNNLQRVNIGAAWNISKNWGVLADWDYNISHDNTQSYLYGVEYNSCCVAVRLIASRIFLSETMNGAKDYRNDYYIQFLLKGLGTVGNKTASDLISRRFSGYEDIF